MIIRLLIMWILASLLSICCAIIAYKRKWYFACGLNVLAAVCSLASLVTIFVRYFIH